MFNVSVWDTHVLQAGLHSLLDGEVVPARKLGRNVDILPCEAALVNGLSRFRLIPVPLCGVCVFFLPNVSRAV